MKTKPGVIARRWWACYRIAAVLLLILISTPFTAPFSTCDAADIVLDTSMSDDHDAKKLDSATRLPAATITIFEPVSSSRQRRPALPAADTPGSAVFALRL